MTSLIVIVFLGTLILAGGGIVLIDKIFGTSGAVGDNAERWCHAMMFQATTLATLVGMGAAWLAGDWLNLPATPAYIALGVFAILWNVLTLVLRPNQDDLRLWNPHNFRHVFVSLLAGVAAGLVVVAQPGGFVPLTFGTAAALLAVFVCFIGVL